MKRESQSDETMKYVVFSLDCELAWGFADLDPPVDRIELMRDDPSDVRDAYRKLVTLFDEFDIPATWAFVGHLFFESCSSETHYRNDIINAADPHSNLTSDPLFYGPDLIDLVSQANVDHDIGGHSFTHPDFREIDSDTAIQELETMSSVAADHGIDIDSFVFPRNAVKHDHLLKKFDIRTYRTPTVGENLILRTGIKPFVTRDKQFWRIPTVRPQIDKNGLVRLPASRLLHEVRWCYLHPIRLWRTIREMKDGEVIHFAFHPHDLLAYFGLGWVLRQVLRIVNRFRERDKIKPITMAQAGSLTES